MVECGCDAASDADGVLVLGDADGSRVRLWHRVASDDGVIDACVEIAHTTDTASLRSATHRVTLAVVAEELTPFLNGLAADFAGWAGERTWQNLDGDLEVGARHVTGGYADLRWTLCSRPYGWVRPWSASVTVRVEAGEQMRGLAADMHRFLHG
ncbi:DUF6228 family protein [Actinophytocola sp. NPDC049390]|uniref:DUF6228 family protein n=1 Tax=Actinophytocola sp. NPDC049390 TaxID=3363894 RepID=UPI003795360F